METSGGITFTDVPADSPFAPAIAQAVEQGVMTGFSDGTFGPDDGVLGQDFGVMLGRAMAGPELAGRPVPIDILSEILENPVLDIESGDPIPRLKASILVVNSVDQARPGLIPDIQGILERLRELTGNTREVARAGDAGLLTALDDGWTGDMMDDPMPRAEIAQLLMNVVQLL